MQLITDNNKHHLHRLNAQTLVNIEVRHQPVLDYFRVFVVSQADGLLKVVRNQCLLDIDLLTSANRRVQDLM